MTHAPRAATPGNRAVERLRHKPSCYLRPNRRLVSGVARRRGNQIPGTSFSVMVFSLLISLFLGASVSGCSATKTPLGSARPNGEDGVARIREKSQWWGASTDWLGVQIH
jgi:hypothetical protein